VTRHLRLRVSHWRHLLGTLAKVMIAALALDAAEVGDTDTATVEAAFTGTVSATDYGAGVTIRVNAVSQTINSATRQANPALVHFAIAAAVDVDDTVTWEYDDDLGDYQDGEGNPMGDIAATLATNYVGAHLRYDTADDAVWIGAT
jgi:hypothetical protein